MCSGENDISNIVSSIWSWIVCQMMHQSQVMRCLWVCVLLCVSCRAFELQDTIHALIEENIQLHDQLENLTRALRELRQLLFHHSDGTEPVRSPSCAGLHHFLLFTFVIMICGLWSVCGNVTFRKIIRHVLYFLLFWGKLRPNDAVFDLDQHHDHDEELQHLWDEWSQHSESVSLSFSSSFTHWKWGVCVWIPKNVNFTQVFSSLIFRPSLYWLM